MRVTVWVCPSFGCGNFFASSTAGDRIDKHCPDCARKGRDVKRHPLDFEDGLNPLRDEDHAARTAARKDGSS